MYSLGFIIKLVHQALEGMTKEERLAFFSEILGGYCTYCGVEEDSVHRCQCMNDE